MLTGFGVGKDDVWNHFFSVHLTIPSGGLWVIQEFHHPSSVHD
jgi:hypothetical protein